MKPRERLLELKNAAAKNGGKRNRVRVGMASCGLAAGAKKVYDAFVGAVGEAGLADVDVTGTGCVGRCDLEPMAEVNSGTESPVLYIRLDPEKAKRIVAEHLVGGRIVEEYAE